MKNKGLKRKAPLELLDYREDYKEIYEEDYNKIEVVALP